MEWLPHSGAGRLAPPRGRGALRRVARLRRRPGRLRGGAAGLVGLPARRLRGRAAGGAGRRVAGVRRVLVVGALVAHREDSTWYPA